MMELNEKVHILVKIMADILRIFALQGKTVTEKMKTKLSRLKCLGVLAFELLVVEALAFEIPHFLNL